MDINDLSYTTVINYLDDYISGDILDKEGKWIVRIIAKNLNETFKYSNIIINEIKNPRQEELKNDGH